MHVAWTAAERQTIGGSGAIGLMEIEHRSDYQGCMGNARSRTTIAPVFSYTD
jgi:hypothetical protein